MLKSITTFMLILSIPTLMLSQKTEMKPAKEMTKMSKEIVKTDDSMTTSKEVEAIKATIKAETSAFWARDYKAWSDTWVQEPYIVWTAATQDGVRQYKGWNAWSGEVKRFIKENPKPDEDNILRADWQIKVYGTGAWVSFIQDWNGSISKETRILENHDGHWKIAFVETLYNLEKNEETNN